MAGKFIDNGKYAAWVAQQNLQKAANDTNNTLAEKANQYKTENASPLDSFFNGIGKSIGSFGNAVGTSLATLGSLGAMDLANSNRERIQKAADQRRDEVAQKYGYADYHTAMNDDNAPDEFWYAIEGITSNERTALQKNSSDFNNNAAVQKIANTSQNQFGADALRTESTLASILGLGVTPVGNAVQGAVEGFADELENTEDGQGIDWGNAAKRMAVGAGSGALTAGLGNKLPNAKTVTGNIAKSAVTGAAGGALSSGATTALGGGSLEDVLNSIGQGASSGALAGGVMGGTMALGGKLAQGAKNAVSDKLQSIRRSGNSRIGNAITDLTSKNGNFGKEYTMFEGGNDPYNAINYLDARGKGVVKGAIPTSENGNVDLPYGTQDYYTNRRTGKAGGGYGLAHISNDNGRDLNDAYNMVDTVRNGSTVTDPKRIVYESNDGARRAVLSDDLSGASVDPYVISAYNKKVPTAESKLNRDAVETSSSSISQRGKNDNTRKAAQFELLQKTNPMRDDYHTGIRSANEIMTFSEALNSPDAGNEFYTYPDWTMDNARRSLESGKVTVYSSKPIEAGAFISPSKMMAQDYAGSGKVYSKQVALDDVAWVNGDEGNYLPVSQDAPSSTLTSAMSNTVNKNAAPSARQDTSDFSAYGQSALANRTKRGMLADGMSRLGNGMEGAQTNITRAAARDLGIESPGAVVESVRKKTGLTDLDTQVRFAKELTGGEDSLMDNIQRIALSASEDGSPYTVVTHELVNKVDGIIGKYADNNTFGSKAKKDAIAQNIKDAIQDRGSDVFTISNRMKAQAADLRGKGVANPPASDSALAKIYSEVAGELDELAYKSVPQSNVDDMFDVAVSEMRTRANAAERNGNKDIAKAYRTAASQLEAEPHTIKAYRSFKKDFVDAAKVGRLTGQAENGAAFQMGSSFVGGLKRGANAALQRPVNTALAKAGGAVNRLADRVAGNGTPSGGSSTVRRVAGNIGKAISRANSTTSIPTWLQNMAVRNISADVAQNESNRRNNNALDQDLTSVLNDYIGQGGDVSYLTIPENLSDRSAANILDALNSIPYSSANSIVSGPSVGSSSLQYVKPTLEIDGMTVDLDSTAQAMASALAAGDTQAYQRLSNIYSLLQDMTEQQNATSGTTSDLSTAEKNQLAKFQTASNAIDQLEALYNKAGGGQGKIGGNLANFAGGMGWNSDVATYNSMAQGLINQIGAAIGKTDSLNTEGEVQRALDLVPKITDTAETAKNKLATLRQLLAANAQSYQTLYGA